jgi:NAD(P)-dependent dehydrogenase (short-subunit alcohol dehydrogenase family)
VDPRTAVVTGGAGAIGGAIVDELRRAGYRTEILDREQCDLADAGDVRRAAAALDAVDVHVHAAATFEQGALTEIDLDESEFEAVRARQALPRSLTPDDVAATVAFLCRDGAEAITGQTLSVDGGLVFR